MGEPCATVVESNQYDYTVYWGWFIQLPREPQTPATDLTAPVYCLSINHGALWVNGRDGRIAGYRWNIKDETELDNLAEEMDWELRSESWDERKAGMSTREHLVRLIRAKGKNNGFFFPGFIDTHIHAPQYPNAGLFGSSTLLDWLNTYTFPMEASYGNQEYPDQPSRRACACYNRVVSRTLSYGTTCAAYFATINVPSTNLLASICHSKGQRAFIGRVCMDNSDTCPDFYRDESMEQMLEATKDSIDYVHQLDPLGTLVKPIITPRFALSCTDTGLTKLGELASSVDPPYHIQSHISENKAEIEWVSKLYPDCQSYAEVYDNANLLTPRTVLAHAVHLSKEERDLIRVRGTGIAHCPASNSALSSGLCPVRTMVDEGIKVGLGTDVSGGHSASILEAARQASLISRLLAYQQGDETNGREKLSVEETLYLATRGGAKVLGMEDEIGAFEEGMFWDAQMIELGEDIEDSPSSSSSQDDVHHKALTRGQATVDIFGFERWDERIAKWMWNGDDRNVIAVWVGGRLVHGDVD
ncbi:hypothetical protein FQN57_001342 [Myotisia sp. PD_48]|nr:hypothetical protein FQN57_001342 [Myotisia sp. PD_48]